MNKETIGWIDIIFKMYKQSHPHGSEIVKDASSRTEVRERLLDYFNRLEEVHKRVAESKSKTGENMLKNFYYDLYVIKPENIPEAYFQNQVRIARERGMGNITLTEEDRKRYADAAIEDQKLTLDKWIEYFLYDDESKSYEMWEKYWVFQGLQSLGKYDKETKKFAKRDDTTVYPFPPVEKECISATIHLMEEYVKSKNGDEEIKSALGRGDFKQLYEYSIKQSMLKGEYQSKTTEGEWVKYEQGSDYHVLRDSLQGYYTGWCTAAGESFARDQLAGGDFYVYYSLDENGDAKVPRIAIRMDGKDRIGEIRGIADGQNMESEMMPILNKKLDEFPDKDNYLKRVHDMELLTLIDKKSSHGKELSVDEIRFLYEIDGKIIGFGYKEDPRINEIKQKRNKAKDYTLMFKYSKDFNRDLDLSGLTSAEGLDLSGANIAGYLDLSSLTSTEGLDLSGAHIGRFLILSSLTSVEGLDLSGTNIKSYVDLGGLISAKGLDLSGAHIGSLNLSSLTSVEGLDLSGTHIGSLNLRGLTSAKDLDLSGAHIGEYVVLSSLTSAEALNLSGANVGRYLNLSGLTNAEGLDLSGVNIGGYLDLSGLVSAEGLDLSGANIGGDLDLSGLTSAKGLDLSGANIGEYVDLSGLISAEGLKLPENIGGVNLSGLTSAEGLKLPENIGGVNLSGLTSAEGLKLPENIGEVALNGLTSAEGLKLPKSIDWLDLSGLTNVEGLMLPYDFELDNLICNDDIKEEIRNNHDKYFAKPPIEEEDQIKDQNFDTKSVGLDSTSKVKDKLLSNENSQEEELNEAAAQKFNDETEALVINGNGDKKVAYVKKYDGTVEKIPYSKNMDKFIGEQKSAMERGESSRFFEISSDPEVAKGQVEALEEIINRNNNLDSADNSKQSDENVVDESMNVHRTR